ncbi:7-cyano-7-deazaguanine synthase 2 [Clostridium aceticum]|uniref:7-cyano-7-deazaguanine synthase n=1 Tax=Clostridium aceticum TaxID=84022 RepID=A0A0D8ICN0_9CLOT|nr:7-cyano-7-deazaguanine synthase QueC [Clostridium aceticum]AKL96366.1 7-cyano-7-deazaguanine synthase 2 [Clostridium aceticum]KJF26951.1 7-cyano-7-deazaguanine synthase [Clostridium aceticum]
MKKAVVLLSGGLDSTTCMAVAKNEGYELYPISFDYNQRHKRELALAKKIADYYGAEGHKIISMENVGGSALTDMSIDVPAYKGDHQIPITYVPARNILFLSYALGYAEVIGAEAIVIGVSAVDYSGYPDCRPEFIEAFQKVVDVGTAAGVEGKSIKIITPLIHLSKAETIELGHQLGAPYHLTTSCYNGEEEACRVCDSCVLRLKGFEEAKLEDPIVYK